MPLTSGTRFGSYQIQGPLGVGGMGEVYRARDERLGRDVAIKVLPEAVAQDADRLGRFEREAKLLASLSHPNIATLYQLEQFEGRTVLVMELAPGEDLTARIDRAPMPLEEVVPIASQIALALEAAHEKGIVHRDLKPANIKIAADGSIKVLDFGLAKAFEATDPSSPGAMNSPTLTAHATQAGIILGTAAYMSPEQARGRPADKRADIWAFGVVVFEMLAGRRLFDGESVSDTLAAVLRQELDWTALPAGTPAELRRLLRRCLERDRRNRLHDIADARIVLEEIAKGGGAEPTTVVAPVRRSGVPGWIAAVIAVATAGIGALAVSLVRPAPLAPSGTPIKFTIPAPAGVRTVNYPALSPDGTFVVFEGFVGQQRKLYIQKFVEVAPRAVEKTDGASSPFVSADSRWIGYWRNNRLEKIPIDGGEPILVVEASSQGPGSTWGPDGSIVYSPAWLGGLSTVPADGGKPRVLTTPNQAAGEKGHWWPQFLPNGKGVLFTIWPAGTGLNDAHVAVLDLSSGKYREIVSGAHAFYVPGFVVFYRAGAYHAIRFDQGSMTTSGSAVRVLDDARALSPEGDSRLSLAAAASGTLVYGPGQRLNDSVPAWLGVAGTLSRLSFAPRPVGTSEIAPDGQRVSASVLDAGRFVIRVFDLTRGTDDLIDMPGSNGQTAWHPDGHRFAFLSMRKGDFDIYVKDLASSAPPAPLLVTDRDESPQDWSPHGKSLLIQQSDADGEYRLKLIDAAHPESQRTLTSKDARDGRISPDGRWLLYGTSASGREEIYVQPLIGDAAPVRLTPSGGESGQWSRRSQDIYYVRGLDILAVGYRNDGGRFSLGSERVAVHAPAELQDTISGFVLAADGRILVWPPASPPVPPQLRVVLNWQHELEQKVSAGR